MTLKSKLTFLSTVLFAITLGLVLIGTSILFKSHTRELYFQRLLERTYTTAYFYFEKDEINDDSYHEIDSQYRRITDESVRVYYADNKKLFLSDRLPLSLDTQRLNRIIAKGNYTFTIQHRQFAGLYYRDNQGDFIIVVSGVDRTGNNQLDSLNMMLLILYLLSIPIQYFLASILAKQTFRPFARLVHKVNTITTENLHYRLKLPSSRKNEINELIINFNYLLERLDNGVSNQKNFLKNVSHELRTPLTIIIGNIDVVLNHQRNIAEYENVLRSSQKEALHLKSILQGLLILSGIQLSDREQEQLVRADEILWNVLERKTQEYPETPIAVNFEIQPEDENRLTVSGNRELLFIAFSNILDNAIKFSDSKQVDVIFSSKGNSLELKIVDNGAGIAKEDLPYIFDLFYRSESSKAIRGQGLGLHITKQILAMHNIGLNIESSPGLGTSITLVFPPNSLGANCGIDKER